VNIKQELLRYVQQNFCQFRSIVFCKVMEFWKSVNILSNLWTNY